MPSDSQKRATRKYQRGEHFKEYQRTRYLNQIKDKYIKIASEQFMDYIVENRAYHPKETEFWEKIQLCQSGRDVKKICQELNII